MPNAEQWRTIINDFNPIGTARSEEVHRFYVDRSEHDQARSVVARLKVNFLNSVDQPKPYKALLTGHVGSGKSTELIRLGTDLSERFFIVWFDAESSLVEGSANQFDVLLAMGVAVHKAAVMGDLNPPKKLVNKLLKSLSKFVRTYEERKGFSLRLSDVLNQVTAGVIVAGVGLVAGPVVAGAAAATAFAVSRLELNVRDDLVRTLELPANRLEVIEALNAIIDFAQSECGRPLLIITDGLDKVSAARAKILFADSALLAEPKCALLYTVPIEFGHRLDAEQAKNLFNECRMLPNPPVQKRPAIGEHWRDAREPNEDGLTVLREIVAKRLAVRGMELNEAITPEALTLLAQSSGGVIRELVRYFREAAVSAQLLSTDRIDKRIAGQVLAQQREEMAQVLKLAHRKTLADVLKQGALAGGEKESVEDDLLRSLHLISYRDEGTFWFDAHPNVLELL
jgi:hypothetical protein